MDAYDPPYESGTRVARWNVSTVGDNCIPYTWPPYEPPLDWTKMITVTSGPTECAGNIHVFGCDLATVCKCKKSKREKPEPPVCPHCGTHHP